ncbi:MAG TPA: CrcB family protein [Alphaproteobacteria bacterium]|nr:CrcB family protein [Alphaproteobacteria bacterium]
MSALLAVALGGAIGAAGRHLCVLWFGGAGFPWAVLGVNVAGSFAMGVLAALLARLAAPAGLQLFLATGILGGFTTFSAFSLDAVRMLELGELLPASGYILGSVALSIAALYLGLQAVRSFV